MKLSLKAISRRFMIVIQIMQEEPFNRLKDKALFENVRVDSGGYGISWSDDIDLSESELWIQGEDIKCYSNKSLHPTKNLALFGG